MNESSCPDDALDGLLRASSPEPLVDDGFVARTMNAVDLAARGLPAVRRPAPAAPIDIARALVAERRHRDAQARRWRWASASVVAGMLLLVAGVAISPGGMTLRIAELPQWYAIWPALAAGALWVAWQEFRAA